MSYYFSVQIPVPVSLISMIAEYLVEHFFAEIRIEPLLVNFTALESKFNSSCLKEFLSLLKTFGNLFE